MSINKFSFFLSFFEVSIRILLIPWTFSHLQIALNLTISRSISIYGFLMSSFMFGRVFGRNIFCGYSGIMTTKIFFFISIIITITFLILSITTRISIISFCFFFIGLSGGIIRTCYNDDFRSNTTTTTNTNTIINILLYKESIALIFIPLFVGLTYNSAVTSRFPALIICYFTSFISIFLLLLQCCNNCKIFQRNGKKSITSISSGSGKNSHNSSGSSSDSRQKSQQILINEKKIEEIDENNLQPPKEFLTLCNNNLETAKKKYYKTLIWKVENNIERILDIPQVRQFIFIDLLITCKISIYFFYRIILMRF